jgi:hypothetical protein
LRIEIAGTRERVDGTSLPASHLRDDMSGGAKTIDAEMFSLARNHQGAPADQAGTQQRCNGDVAACLPECKTIAGVRDKVGGKPSVARVAGEERAIA